MSSQAPPEKTTHDLVFCWTLWTTVPNIDPSLEEEEDFDEFALKESQKPVPIHKVADFQSFEDYWKVYKSVERPSSIQGRGGHYYFKQGIKPRWDDAANYGGVCVYGKYDVPCTQDAKSRKIEQKFLHVLMTILGKNFILSEKVNGVIFESTKSGAKISTWVTPVDETEKEYILRQLGIAYGKSTNIQIMTINEHMEEA